MRAYTACEDPEYTAPEALLNVSRMKPVDCWTSGFQRWGGAISKYFDNKAKPLVKHLLTTDLSRHYASLKYGANDVVGHRWFSSIEWASFEAQMRAVSSWLEEDTFSTMEKQSRSEVAENGFQAIREVTSLTDVMGIVHCFLHWDLELEGLHGVDQGLGRALADTAEVSRVYVNDLNDQPFDVFIEENCKAVIDFVQNRKNYAEELGDFNR